MKQAPLPANAIPVDIIELPDTLREFLTSLDPVTPRLEHLWREPMGLKVLSRQQLENILQRHVILYGRQSKKSVERAFIQLTLDLLPASVVHHVLAETASLGTLMKEAGIPFFNSPVGYFKVIPPSLYGKDLGFDGVIYGRQTCLSLTDGKVFGHGWEMFVPC